MKHLNFFIFVFILYMYISGVGANPGNLPCTTCVRPGCKRYTVGGKPGGGDFKIKNIIKYIGFDLFYFMSEIHCTNVMHLILFMSEMSEILYYSCEEADSESESIELHALELPLELLFMILWIT